MNTSTDIILGALENVCSPTDIVHNDQELLQLLNRILDELSDEQPSRLVD